MSRTISTTSWPVRRPLSGTDCLRTQPRGSSVSGSLGKTGINCCNETDYSQFSRSDQSELFRLSNQSFLSLLPSTDSTVLSLMEQIYLSGPPGRQTLPITTNIDHNRATFLQFWRETTYRSSCSSTRPACCCQRPGSSTSPG